MKKLLTIGFCFLLTLGIKAQIIATDPEFPTDNAQVILTYDATKGNAGLEGYTGEVYAHIGVLTNLSTSNSDWKYVIAAWDENVAKAKCTSLGNDKWELTLTPNIREYFGVPATEEIKHIALVFRSGDRTREGKGDSNSDILIEVFEEQVSLKLTAPAKSFFFVDANEQISIEAQSSLADHTKIYVDDQEVHNTTDANVSYTHTAEADGTHTVRVVAYNQDESESAEAGFVYTIRSQGDVQALPAGVTEGINIIDNNTVTLVLHAPNKESVYVIGDFNDWTPSSDYVMHASLSDKNDEELRFWITIDNLDPATEYGFQYIVDETLRIPDPYTEKILDPWNDQWIPSEVYPNLRTYPSDKTEGVISTFQIQQEAYNWEITDFEAPSKADMVVYEMHLRDFTEGPDGSYGTYATAMEKLDYLQELGVNVVELMPINEFEGNNSWGYNPSFLFAVDKAYGTKNDLKLFVDECHKRGMAIVIDIVMNHSYGLSPFVQLYLDNYGTDEIISLPESPWFNVQSPNQSYKWGADFNHESKFTQALLDRMNAFWLTEFKVDGFRFDFTKGFTNTAGDGWARDNARIALLKRMYDQIAAVNPDAYVILEHLTDNSEEKELAEYGLMLWGNMNHNYNEATMGFTESNKSDLSNAYYINRNWTQPHLVSYMESHDEERLMYKNTQYGNASGAYSTKSIATALQRMELAANFFFTIPGPKMIWQFGELGYDVSIDEPGRVDPKPVKWDYFEEAARKRLYDVYSALTKLKVEEDAFENGTVAYDLNGALKSIVVDGTGTDVVAVGNFDVGTGDISVTFTQTGTWYDFYTGATFEVSAETQTITLQAGEYHLYTSTQLDVPNVQVLSIRNVLGENVRIYPNPTTEKIVIENAENLNKITIFDLSGKIIEERKVAQKQQLVELNVSDVSNGILFLMLQNAQGEAVLHKVVKQ